MRAETEPGVREVGRIDDRLHVEEAAVVRLAYEPEELGRARHRLGLGRPTGQNREAELVDPGEPAPERLAAHCDLVVPRRGKFVLDLGAPQPSRR